VPEKGSIVCYIVLYIFSIITIGKAYSFVTLYSLLSFSCAPLVFLLCVVDVVVNPLRLPAVF